MELQRHLGRWALGLQLGWAGGEVEAYNEAVAIRDRTADLSRYRVIILPDGNYGDRLGKRGTTTTAYESQTTTAATVATGTQNWRRVSFVSPPVATAFNTTAGKQEISDSYSIRRETLMKGLPYFTTLTGARAAVGAMEAARAEGSRVVASVVSPTPYAKYQEFGTRHNAAHPFLRPALLESRGEIASLISRSSRSADSG